VHRDVSPQNILVSYDGEVKVVDFGIAKAEARTTETQAGVLKGKFAYMAPEQVMGDQIDRRADIFALGSVLFETLTGQRLFTGDSDMALLENVRSARLPDLQQSLPPGSEELQVILQRTLTRRPKDRYSYASEFGDDLERLLIEDRAIFGSKRASQFMQTLYVAEIAELADKIRDYVQVTAQSCVEHIDGGLEMVSPDAPASAQDPSHPPQDDPHTPVNASQSAGDYSNWAEVEPLQPELSNDASLVEPPGRGSVHANVDVNSVARGAGDTPRSDAYVYREQQAIGEAPRSAPRPTARVARRSQEPRSLQATLQASEGHTPSSVTTDRRALKQQAQSRITTSRLVGTTAEQDNPLLQRSGRVLQRLTFVATAAVGVLAVLVVMIFFESRKMGQVGGLPGPLNTVLEAIVQHLPASLQPSVDLAAQRPTAPPPAPLAAEQDDGQPGATGWLQLKSTAGQRGRVLIDNKDVGILPLTPRQLAVGRHEIRLVPGSGRGRGKLIIVNITAKHTRRAPRQAGF
jgi:serine/threonine protein kinase